MKLDAPILFPILREVIDSNINKIEFAKKITGLHLLDENFLEKEFTRLLFDITSLSSELLNFEDFCSLIEIFASWSSNYKNRFKIARMFKNMILNKSNSGKNYPIYSAHELKEKMEIFNRSLKHLSRVSLSEIFNVFLLDFNRSKIGIEGYQKIYEIILELEGYGKTKIKEGISYQKQGNQNKALNCFIEVLDYNIKNKDWLNTAITHILIANIYSEQKNYDEAIKFYHKSIELNVKENNWDAAAQTLRTVAKIFSKKEQYNKAISSYEKVIEYSIKIENWKLTAISNIAIGKLLTELGKFDDAISFYNKAIEVNIKISNWEEIAVTYNTIGNLFYNRENFSHAISFYEKAIEYSIKIKNWKAIRALGISYSMIGKNFSKLGKFTEAISFYEKTIELNINNKKWKYVGISYNYIGDIYVKLGELNDAFSSYETAIFYDEKLNNWSGIASSFIRNGTLYLENEYYNEALNSFLKAIHYNLKSAQIPNIEEGFKLTKEGYYTKSIDYYERIIDGLDKKNVKYFGQIFNLIGILFLRQKNYDLALKFCKKAKNLEISIQNLKGISLTYLTIGKIYKEIGDLKSAIHNYKLVIKTDIINDKYKNIARTFITMGNIYLEEKNYNKVIKCYNKAIYFDIRNKNWKGISLANTKLAEIYLISNEFNKAINSYKLSIKSDLKIKNFKSIIFTLRKISNAYIKQNKFEEAIQYLKKVYEIFLNTERQDTAAKLCEIIGDIYVKQEKYDNAIKAYEKLLTIYEASDNWEGLSKISILIGNIFFKKQVYTEAIKFYENAIEYQKKYEAWKNIAQTLMTIAKVHSINSRFEYALNYYFNALYYDKKNNKWDKISIALTKIANILSMQGKSLRAANYYDYAIIYAQKSKDNKILLYAKIKKAILFRDFRVWKKAIGTYNEIITHFKEENSFFNVIYYKIQSLKCQGRSLEENGEYEQVPKIYKEIANKYKKIHKSMYSTLYRLIYEIFNTNILSKEGYHKKCISQLDNIKKKLNKFIIENNSSLYDYFKKLINFRIKQIELYTFREKAFIFEEERNYDESINCFEKCASFSNMLFIDKFKADSQLYKILSKYYSAQSKRIEFHKSMLDIKLDSHFHLSFLETEVLPLFYEVKDFFFELNQNFREKSIFYEICLLEGKALELDNQKDIAYIKYEKALVILNNLNTKRINQFHESLVLFQEKDQEFPIEDFSLKMPSLGSTLIDYCDLSDIEFKHKFFRIYFENLPIEFNFGEKYQLYVRLELSKSYFDYFEEGFYVIQFHETREKKKFFIEKEIATWSFKFEVPNGENKGKKEFNFELIDKNGNVVTTEKFYVNYSIKNSKSSTIMNIKGDEKANILDPPKVNYGKSHNDIEDSLIEVDKDVENEQDLLYRLILESKNSELKQFLERRNANEFCIKLLEAIIDKDILKIEKLLEDLLNLKLKTKLSKVLYIKNTQNLLFKCLTCCNSNGSNLTTEKIMKALSKEWQNVRSLILKLDIMSIYDAKWLKIKLKELERKDKIITKELSQVSHWKLNLLNL